MLEVIEARFCQECQKFIPSARVKRQPRIRFCSQACNNAYTRRKVEALNGRAPDRVQLNQGTVGALSELIVSADLMRRGYHVFRALSPACPCDLIIMKGDIVKRIEVRTGTYNLNGTISYPRNTLETHTYDILAITLREIEVVYMPPLDTL